MRKVQMIEGRPLRESGNPTALLCLGIAAFMHARFALVKMGGGVIGMSGSIGGNTFARNRTGNYVRARTKPVNPNSVAQGEIRTAMSALTNMWSQVLDAAQRTAWNTYANSISMKNRLGEATFLTGFNHFVRSNSEALRQGMDVAQDGPTTLLLPSKDTTFAITASAATQKISVVFDNTQPWAGDPDGALFLYQGQPRNVTRGFFAGPWKYMAKISGATTPAPTSPAVLDPSYTLIEGQLITCYARVREADGRLSEPFDATCVVAA